MREMKHIHAVERAAVAVGARAASTANWAPARPTPPPHSQRSKEVEVPFGVSTEENPRRSRMPEDARSAPRTYSPIPLGLSRTYRQSIAMRILATRPCSCYISGLTEIFQPERSGDAHDAGRSPSAETIERDIIEILKRVSRRPIDPTGASELLADLGFDSLQVLELVGELEDHFNIAVPLNTLTHIRTVGDIAGEVYRLTSAESPT